MILPAPLNVLIAELTKLPTVGEKSARRMAFSLLHRGAESLALAKAIEQAIAKIQSCPVCFALTDGECTFCNNPNRNSKVLCVVEEASNIFTIEMSHFFTGLYHVLEGSLSPIKGITSEKLRIAELHQRFVDGQFSEVILATNPTVEGEATAYFLKSVLAPYEVNVSKLAIGMPSGGDLEFSDPITLKKAFAGRNAF